MDSDTDHLVTDGNSTADPEPRPTLEQAQAEFGSALLAFAISILRDDPERARDVVQDVFLKLHRQGTENIAPGRLKSWLYTVCRNRAIDIIRKEKPMTTTDATELQAVRDDSPDPAMQAERREQQAEVLGLVERLPDNQREVVRLKFQSDLSYREIADVTQLSVSNVGFLLHGAMKKLRQMAAALPQ
jgi:RNA polymerase sigma factor (sigma-70 family)